MTITIKEQTFITGEVSLNYAEVQMAAPPLLLHGCSWQWHNFEILTPDLAAGWYLFALDLRVPRLIRPESPSPYPVRRRRAVRRTSRAARLCCVLDRNS